MSESGGSESRGSERATREEGKNPTRDPRSFAFFFPFAPPAPSSIQSESLEHFKGVSLRRGRGEMGSEEGVECLIPSWVFSFCRKRVLARV